MSVTTEQLEELTRQLTDAGKLIEAGFVGMRLHCMSPDAPPAQVREMRFAYMTGAQHLFASLMTVLEPGDEPSEEDLRRLALIDAELRAWLGELKRWVEGRNGT